MDEYNAAESLLPFATDLPDVRSAPRLRSQSP
jgi:hypothetical protein